MYAYCIITYVCIEKYKLYRFPHILLPEVIFLSVHLPSPLPLPPLPPTARYKAITRPLPLTHPYTGTISYKVCISGTGWGGGGKKV